MRFTRTTCLGWPRTLALLGAVAVLPGCAADHSTAAPPGVYDVQEQYVDAHGELIYVTSFGRGDPLANGIMSWDLYREMWGSHGEFVVDGNLASVEYADSLKRLAVPTLVTAGDHDECDPDVAREMASLIPGAKLVVFPTRGHMTFVDQPGLFMNAVDGFLHAPAPYPDVTTWRSARPAGWRRGSTWCA